MIVTFEGITVELNEKEQNLVPVIIRRFRNKPGRENTVTNKQMIAGIFEHKNIKLTEPRIRKIVQFIRINNLLPGLVGTSKGYFLTRDVKEFESWIQSMKQRENSIRESRTIGEKNLEFIKQQYYQKQENERQQQQEAESN